MNASAAKPDPSPFAEACERLGLDAATCELLARPSRVTTVRMPVRGDDGRSRMAVAHRVVFNTARGPALGGLRWHPSTSLPVLIGAAARRAWQSGLLGLPHGGAAGALDGNPKELSTSEKERVVRAFTTALGSELGRDRDVLTLDTYVTPQILGWIEDAGRVRGLTGPITAGKPTAMGGIPATTEATAWGVASATAQALRRAEVDPAAMRIAVAGFGNLGRAIARAHHADDSGVRLVGVSDSRHGRHAPDGLDVLSTIHHKVQNTSMIGMTEGREVDPDEVLSVDADVLYLASASPLVDERNVDRISAKVVVAVGEGVLSPLALASLARREVIVIPRLLASGGRLVLAHLELTQGTAADRYTEEELQTRVRRALVGALDRAWDMAEAESCDLHLGAWMVGIEAVAEACRARGWC
jgi:glutamate dehydrogenase (NAD(P)+)